MNKFEGHRCMHLHYVPVQEKSGLSGGKKILFKRNVMILQWYGGGAVD